MQRDRLSLVRWWCALLDFFACHPSPVEKYLGGGGLLSCFSLGFPRSSREVELNDIYWYCFHACARTHTQRRQPSCCCCNPTRSLPAPLQDTQAKSDAEHCSACARYFVELCYKFQVSVIYFAGWPVVEAAARTCQRNRKRT